jgi:predicted nucleotidyltransferase
VNTDTWTVDTPDWAPAVPSWDAVRLRDRQVRYADKFRMANGWIYKAVGDLHPEWGILAVPDWAPAGAAPPGAPARRGMVKVRDNRWPDGTAAPRNYPFARVPLYGRMLEVIRDDDILAPIHPEEAAASLLGGATTTPDSVDVARLLESLVAMPGVAAADLGVNGSYACGLNVATSDIDLDVYGRAGIRAVGAGVRALLGSASSQWTQRWPPDEQTNLYFVWHASYREQPLPALYELFEVSGRNVFNFRYADRRVSISYHSRTRRQHRAAAPAVLGGPGAKVDVTATFAPSPEYEHLDLPSMFQVRDAVTSAGTNLASALVVSYSKAFGFCRPGDRVRFAAVPLRSSSGPALVIPSYGPQWPVRPVSTG